MRRALLASAALLAAVTLAGCASPAPVAQSPSADPTPTPTQPAPSPTLSPATTPTPTPSTDPAGDYSAREAAYLDAVLGNLQPLYFDQFDYMGADGRAEYWLAQGYNTCSLLDSWGVDRTAEFLQDAHANPRWYGDGIGTVMTTAAADDLCA